MAKKANGEILFANGDGRTDRQAVATLKVTTDGNLYNTNKIV